MAVMQEFGELFAQALVAFATVADHDRVLEQLFLDRRRKLCKNRWKMMGEQRCVVPRSFMLKQALHMMKSLEKEVVVI